MNNHALASVRARQALVERCAAQRIELQRQAMALRDGGALRRTAARAFPVRRIAFHMALVLAGERKIAALMAVASQMLLLAKLFASIRKAARVR